MELSELQRKVTDWNNKNFPTAPSHLALIKMMEELGELAGHYIGRREHRDGKKVVDHQAGIEDGVADVVIALCVFCHREKIDLSTMVDRAWDEVSKRTFTVIPQEAKAAILNLVINQCPECKKFRIGGETDMKCPKCKRKKDMVLRLSK